MRYVVNGAQMKRCDLTTIEEFGMPSLVLMERAALAVVQELHSRRADLSRTLVLCGTGNNGGDGAAIARLLHLEGHPVEVALVGDSDRCSPDMERQLHIIKNYGVKQYSDIPDHEYTTVIDAIFGIGLSRDVEGECLAAIRRANGFPGFKVAVDIPSGVCAEDGRILGEAFRADLTVTFAFPKIGLLLYPGAACAGEVAVRDIGITDQGFGGELPHIRTLSHEDFHILPERPAWSHKGTFGKTLIVGGQRGMAGAVMFAARAALYMGAGLAHVCTPEANRVIIQTGLPEAVLTTYPEEAPDLETLGALIEQADALVVGPGMGTGEGARAILETALGCGAQQPLILDADALNLLAQQPSLLKRHKGPVILTPHLGEMGRLCRREIVQIREDLIGTAEEFAREYQVICVLKDARTIITDGESTYINTSGNNGMATGGSGDVLSGILGGMCRKSCKDLTAMAALGVYIHGLSGEQGSVRYGMHSLTASGILEGLAEVMKGQRQQLLSQEGRTVFR